jgi:hypothetical protein
MNRRLSECLHICYVFYLSLCASVQAADQSSLSKTSGRRGYSKGDLMPVSCMNRTLETGEHIMDDHGNLQYIPFPTCNETNLPLAFLYATPQTQTCTIDALPDELYHLFEFFVHSDVPLTCRIPTYPLGSDGSSAFDSNAKKEGADDMWTPFTIALQGTLQLSHMHLHTNINVLFHTSDNIAEPSHLLGSTAYSLPNASENAAREGTKIVRYEPLVLSFDIGWVDGTVLPGMVGRPVLGVKDHSVGFSLLSLFALAASAGVGAMGMLIYERKKSGRSGIYGNGLLGGNIGSGGARSTGYGGYGNYTSGVGKRD